MTSGPEGYPLLEHGFRQWVWPLVEQRPSARLAGWGYGIRGGLRGSDVECGFWWSTGLQPELSKLLLFFKIKAYL